MFKRLWLWCKGYRSGSSYIGRVKRQIANGYEIKLVNNKIINAQLINNLDKESLPTNMIVTINYQAGKWFFHVPVWA